MIRLLFIFSILLFSQNSWSNTIQSIRVAPNETGTRLVFDLDSDANYKTFTLPNPARLVIDLKHYQPNKKIAIPSFENTSITSLRHAAFDQQTLRVVLDLSKKVPYKTHLLKADDKNPHRLVIDLTDPQHSVTAAAPQKPIAAKLPEQQATPTKVKSYQAFPRRDIVIAIDAGHGGKDTGAIGKNGTREKDVVLAIAKRLAKLVDKEPGMRAYMTRNRDVFISLRERIHRAKVNGADMFISIHADAFHNTKARGSSVYVLSSRGASSEAAKILASRENAADLAGGITLEDKDDLLASVLIDLSQTASLEASTEVAEDVLSGLKRVGHVHKKRVESASFVVLKSPDIPSLLVETAFISNPTEEKKLKSSDYQNKLAQAMMVGVRNYFKRNPLPMQYQPQQHIVSRGDTLSMIAQRYQVSMAEIKTVNNLSNPTIHVGDILKIP